MKLRVFTDGACSGNPGIGGWGCIFLLPDKIVKVSGGNKSTTNNRMELTAALQALKQFYEQFCFIDGIDKLEIYSDSAYVVNSINKGWMENWRNNKWETKEGKYIKNNDLWAELSKTYKIIQWLKIEIEFIKVEGHSGVEFNELADELAKSEVLKRRGQNAKLKL